MDPNDSNQNSTNPPEPVTEQPVDNQQQMPSEPVVQAAPAQNPADQGNPVQELVQPVPDTQAPVTDYVNEVGEDLIDLLDEISEDNNLLQVVANEMKLDPTKVQSMLASVLDKIDKEQITTEDLALIMASTAADETPDNG